MIVAIIRRFIIIWLAGWCICAVSYIAGKYIKSMQQNTPFLLKKQMHSVSLLLFMWPMAFFNYIYYNIKVLLPKNKN